MSIVSFLRRYASDPQFAEKVRESLAEEDQKALLVAAAMEAVNHKFNLWEWSRRAEQSGNDYLQQRRYRRLRLKSLIASDPFAKLTIGVIMTGEKPEVVIEYLFDVVLTLISAQRLIDGDLGTASQAANAIRNWERSVAEFFGALDAIKARGPAFANGVDLLEKAYWNQMLEDESSIKAFVTRQFLGVRIGSRGGAKVSEAAALRGWLIRALHMWIPESLPERYSIIAGLLGEIGISVDSRLVRSTLMGGRT